MTGVTFLHTPSTWRAHFHYKECGRFVFSSLWFIHASHFFPRSREKIFHQNKHIIYLRRALAAQHYFNTFALSPSHAWCRRRATAHRGAAAADTLSCGHLYANRCRHGVHCCVLYAVAEWLHQNMHSPRQICIHTSSINSPYCAEGFAFAHQSRCAKGLSNRRRQQQKKLNRVQQGGCQKRRVGKDIRSVPRIRAIE